MPQIAKAVTGPPELTCHPVAGPVPVKTGTELSMFWPAAVFWNPPPRATSPALQVAVDWVPWAPIATWVVPRPTPCAP